jgi:hypothetical protein
MAQNRPFDRIRPAIMQKALAHAQPPQRHGAHLRAARLALLDTIAKLAHVMQQEIAVRVERRPADGLNVRGAGGPRRHVTAGTADPGKDLLTVPRFGCDRAARRRGQEPHEIGKGLHPGAIVFEARHWVTAQETAIAVRAIFHREVRARDPHLVEVGVAGKLHQGRRLGFVPEAPRPGRLAHVLDLVHPASDGLWLARCHPVQGPVRDGLDEAQSEERCGLPLGHDGGLWGHRFPGDDAVPDGADAVGLQQRPAAGEQGVELLVGVCTEAGLDHGRVTADRRHAVAGGA